MYQGLLRSIPLFGALPDEELHLLAERLTPVEHPAGVFIFREGDPNDRFSIIAGGEVEITRTVDENTERVLQTLRRGDFFGEMSLLFPDSVRSASGRSLTPVQLLEMKGSQFDLLLRRRPALAVEILLAVQSYAQCDPATRAQARRLLARHYETIGELPGDVPPVRSVRALAGEMMALRLA